MSACDSEAIRAAWASNHPGESCLLARVQRPGGGSAPPGRTKTRNIQALRMIMPGLIEIPLASIEVGTDRARDLEPAWVEALAKLIDAQGLLHPIVVRPVDGMPGRYRLVAGLHRLEGVRLNGWEAIPAYLSRADSDAGARLEEVMENLGRYDLNALDRCHHLYELRQIWLRQHPEFANGGGKQGGGKSFPTGDQAPEVFGFAASVAEQIGFSKRVINIAVAIWTGLSPTSRRRLVGTALAGKQTELKALSEESPPRQEKILDLILGEDHADISNVAGALAFLEGGVQPTGDEVRLEGLRKSMSTLPDTVFDRLISENADRTIASLKRLGRI